RPLDPVSHRLQQVAQRLHVQWIVIHHEDERSDRRGLGVHRPSTVAVKRIRQYDSSRPAASFPRVPRSTEKSTRAAPPPRKRPLPPVNAVSSAQPFSAPTKRKGSLSVRAPT